MHTTSPSPKHANPKHSSPKPGADRDLLRSGQILGDRFEALQAIDGGAGRVWLLHDREIDERVVAKIFSAAQSETESSELRLARTLQHPNVVPIYDVHRVDDLRFMTMAWISDGHAGNLRGGDSASSLRVVSQVVDALEYLHGQGWVHRDLKASNILLGKDGQAYLSDFGMAMSLAEDGTDTARSGGGSRFAVGPQQLKGEAPSVADDLYGLGALLYDLLAGEPPFWPEVSDADILEGSAGSLSEKNPSLPAGLVSLVHALLDKSAPVRPSLSSVRAALKVALHRLQATGQRPVLKPPPRRPEIVAAADPELASEVAPKVSPDVTRAAEASAPLPKASMGVGAWSLLAALLLATVAVFALLPRWVESERSSDSVSASEQAAELSRSSPESSGSAKLAASRPEPADPGPVDLGRVDLGPVNPEPTDPMIEAAQRRQARQQLERLAADLERLQARKVDTWGGSQWRQFKQQVESGHEHFKARRWDSASAVWDTAAAALNPLERLRAQTVSQAMASGHEALKRGDAGAAGGFFSRVLELEPGNGPAEVGLRRAQVRDQVMEQLADALAAESRGSLAESNGFFNRALALDPRSSEAREGVIRTRDRQSRNAFGRAMGRGYEALAAGDLDAAGQAFDQAEGLLDPKAGEGDRVLDARNQVRDARNQVTAAQRLAKIESLRSRGSEQEQAEQWRAAEASYRAVLAIDGVIGFALDGLDRSTRRAELAEHLEGHLQQPERLSTGEVLAEAERVLRRAQAVEKPGAGHRRQIAELERWVRRYGATVSAELVSDQATQVWIYKVGQLGAFDRRSVELRPGTYTVAGSREGFRDVRLKWVIEPGVIPDPLVVRCEEEI